MKSSFILFFLVSTFLIFSLESKSQSITWGPTSPPGIANELHVYSINSTSTFEFTNGVTALTSPTIQVDLGVGVEYVSGNLTFTSTGSAVVTEASATGDNPALFNISNLAIGETVSITFERQANCDARDHKANGGTFSDVCHVFENGTEVIYANNSGDPYTVNYSVVFGNLVLGQVTYAPSSSVAVGGITTRSLTITNGRFGSIDEFWYMDTYVSGSLTLSNFMVNGVAIPAANVTNNAGNLSIHFDPAIIALIDGSNGTNGNGDVLFEKDEFFELSYDVTALTCGINNVLSSDLKTYYGASETMECAPSGEGATSVTISNGTPEVVITSSVNPGIDFCGTTTHTLTITNNGTNADDFAKDIIFFIGLRSNNSPISTHNNVTMWGSTLRNTKFFSNITLNGNPITASQIGGGSNTMVDYIPPNTFTTNVDGPGGLEDLDMDGFFDDLGPGKSVTVGFDMTLIPQSQACGTGSINYVHWEHISMDIAWLNQCGSLQTPIRKEFNYTNFIRNYLTSTFTSGPSDIEDGESFDVAIKPHITNSIRCNGANGNVGPDVKWTVKVVLPPGASLQGGATTDPANAAFNPSLYQSNDTVYYTIDRYRYDWFTFPLTLDCSTWDGTAPLPFNFITTYDCNEGCFTQDIHCETVYAAPHCGQGCVGITTDDFTAERTTPGWTDATMSTPVALTNGTHGLDQVLPFDTIKLCVKGHISDTTSDNLHLRIGYSPDAGGDIFDYTNGEITIYDIDASFGNMVNTFPITSPPTVNNLGGGDYEWVLDLSGYLAQIDNMYLLESAMAADSFKVTLYSVFNKNTGANYYSVNNFRANFFMYDDVPIERSCDSYGSSMNYTGFSSNSSGATITLQGCEQKSARSYATWQNFSGDIFPNEYRPIQRIDSIIWDIPSGFNVLNVTPAGTNGTVSYSFNAAGQVVGIPNNDYTPNDWTTTHYPGHGITLGGSCETVPGLNTGTIYIHRTFYNYHPNTDIHQPTSNTVNGSPRITYIEPDVIFTPLGQIQPGISETVEWDIEVCNGTSAVNAAFTWMTFDETSSDGITITDVLDVTTGPSMQITTTNLGGGLEMIPLGIPGGDCKTIRLVASYSSCAADSLSLELGWDCIDYPTNLTDLNQCDIPTFLSVVPLDAQMAATLTNLAATPINPAMPATGNYNENTIVMCEPFPVEFTIISSGPGTIYDINFDITIPGFGAGLEYVPNSATIEVEGIDAANMPRLVDPAGETAFATATGATWNIDLADLDNTNFSPGAGLTGAGTNANQNEVTIRWQMQSTCNFTSGDNIKIQSFSTASCSGESQGYGETSIGNNLNVEGIVLPYAALMTSNITPPGNFVGCVNEKTMTLDIFISGGTTGNSDSLLITLPPGLTYTGNQSCTSVNCPVFLGTQFSQGKEVLLYEYPSGIFNEVLTIEVDLVPTVNAACSADNIEIKSTVNVGGISCGPALCPSVKVVTGAKDEAITVEKADFALNFTKITVDPNTGVYNYSIDAINNSSDSDGPLTLDVYCLDNSGNPILLGGNVGTITIPQTNSGQTATVTGILPANSCVPADGLIAVLDTLTENNSLNCVCNRAENKYTNITEVLQPGTIAQDQTICPTADPLEITVTVAASGGAGLLTYQWQQSVNCTGVWMDIPGETDPTFDPPALTETTCYQRVVTEPCLAVAISNTITITVSDTEDPVIMCPAPISQNVDAGVCGAIVSYTVTFSDNCPGETLTQTAGLASGAQFPVGTTTNIFMVTDFTGNTATCSFDVTITDNEPPTVVCPSTINQGVDMGTCGAEVNYNVTSADNCPGETRTQTAGLPSGAQFPVGTTINTFRVIDVAGNVTTCSFNITIVDDEAPVANCPQNVTQTVPPGACNAIVNYTVPTFNDNCDGNGLFGTQVAGPISGTVFPVGITTVTYFYTDNAGNGPVICSFDVEVVDAIPPMANCQNISLELDANGTVSITPTDIDNSSSDNCAIASMTLSQTTFDCSNSGTMVVILTVSDAAGNQSTCSANVVLDATPIPDFDCPTSALANCDGNFVFNFDDLNLATVNLVSAAVSGSAAPYVLGDISPGGNAYIDPLNVPLNIPLTLIYTLQIGSCSTASSSCTFTVVKSNQSNAGGF